jgi:hypothetical protein
MNRGLEWRMYNTGEQKNNLKLEYYLYAPFGTVCRLTSLHLPSRPHAPLEQRLLQIVIDVWESRFAKLTRPLNGEQPVPDCSTTYPILTSQTR